MEEASTRRSADRSQLLRAVDFVAARGEEARSEACLHFVFALWSTSVRGECSRRAAFPGTSTSQLAPAAMQSRMRTPLQSEDAGGKSTVKGARRRVESQENEPPRNDLTRPAIAHFRYNGNAHPPSEALQQQQQHFRSLPLASLVEARLAAATNPMIPTGQPPTSSRSSSAEPRGGSGQLRPAPSEPVARRHPSRAASPPPSPHPPPPPSPGQMNQRSTWQQQQQQQTSLGNRGSAPRGGELTQPAGTPAPSARPSPRSSPLGRPLAVVASASTTALWRRNGAVQESQSQHEVRRSAARSIRTSESGNPQSSPHVQSTRQLPPYSGGSYAPASSPAQAARGEPPPAAAQAPGRQPALSTASSTGSFIPASQGAGSFTAPSGSSAVPQGASNGTPGPQPAAGVQRSGSHTPLGTPSGTTPSPLSRTQPTASAQPPHARLIRRG